MTDIVKQQSFEERMIDRIRESIGELMTDEELSKIVSRAMEEIFFKSVTIQDGYYTREKPPFLHQFIKDLLKDQVQDAVSKYIQENKDVILNEIQRIISLGMGKALMEAISAQFSYDLMNFQNNLIATIQNK